MNFGTKKKAAFSSLTLALVMAGCAAVKGTKEHTAQNSAKPVTDISSSECSVTLEKIAQEAGCSRGVFVVDVLKDYVQGARTGEIIQISGAGVAFNKKDEKTNPYDFLNYGAKKKIDPGVLADLGNAISIEFGNEPVEEIAGVANRSTLRQSMGFVSTSSGSTQAKGQSVYFSKKNADSKTYHIQAPGAGVGVARADDEVQAVKGTADYGVADLKSFNIGISGKYFAVPVPTDIESEKDLNRTVTTVEGSALEIPVNPRPDLTKEVKAAFFSIAIADLAADGKHHWNTCRMPDTQQDVLKVPSKWASGSISTGAKGLELTRSYIYAIDYPDEQGGKLCIQSGAGVRTYANVKKKE